MFKGGIFCIAAVLTVAASQPSQAAERRGRCHLVLGDAPEIDGPCRYDRDGDGGLSIRSLGRPAVFAVVTRDGASGGFAAYWNGFEHASHAHESLGRVTRRGSCFVNRDDTVRVCAWEK